jgi:primosomal replication protein N
LKHCDTHQSSIQREEYEEQIAENPVKVLDVSGKQNDIITRVISKGKVHPVIFLAYTEGRRGCSTNPFATSTLEEMDDKHHATAT